jgi:DNA helicase-2/ATP-dependent DNA helicase PcrA
MNKGGGMHFSAEQLAALGSKDRITLVSACPGAGKTAVLTARAVRMIDQGIDPSNMLAVTFTKKAAQEMSDRMVASIGEKARMVRIGTLHSLALEIIRELGGWKPKVADEQLVAIAVDAVSTKFMWRPDDVRAFISLQKAAGAVDHEMVRAYQAELKGHCDFDDFLIFALNLLKDPHWHHSIPYRHLLVDEGQDINLVQKGIIEKFLGLQDSTLFMVGDPDQSIYKFRGADPDLFSSGFADCLRLRLSHNFRSGATVVRRCQQLASCSYAAGLNDIGQVEWFESGLREDEMLDLVARVGKEPKFSDVAVLTRTNAQGAEIAVALRAVGIPVLADEQMINIKKFTSLKALLKVVIAPKKASFEDFFKAANLSCKYLGRAYRRDVQIAAKRLGCSPWEASKEPMSKPYMNYHTRNFKSLVIGLINLAKRTKDPQLVVREAIVKTNFLERWKMDEEDLLSIIRLAHGKRTLAEVVEAMESFVADMEDGVRVMTIHKSKGLEFDSVYIPGVNRGNYPHKRATDVDEEKRILFVGITRARRRLVISWHQEGEASPFLSTLGLPPTEIERRFFGLYKHRKVVKVGYEGENLIDHKQEAKAAA